MNNIINQPKFFASFRPPNPNFLCLWPACGHTKVSNTKSPFNELGGRNILWPVIFAGIISSKNQSLFAGIKFCDLASLL